MIHPTIPIARPSLTVHMGSHNLRATIEHEGSHFSFPLPQGRAERILESALLHIASGLSPGRIVEHFLLHTQADSQCPCCKLEGRVLAGQGRRAPSQADRIIASRSHSGGTVQVRHIKPGLSGAQLRAYEEAYFKRASRPAHAAPQKSTKQRIEELI